MCMRERKREREREINPLPHLIVRVYVRMIRGRDTYIACEFIVRKTLTA